MQNGYQQYLKDRHEEHVASRSSLDDHAFKTCERYDQWVLTLSGGALAISLTFLEKIAPHPLAATLILLGLSWLAYILAVLSGFWAISVSRQAIYRQLEIGDDTYEQFRKTTTAEKPEGDSLPEPINCHVRVLTVLNRTSLTCLILGTILMCSFAFGNIEGVTVAHKALELPPQFNVNVNMMSQVPTNNVTVTNKPLP
jgi:uncharacterized membrane protein